MKKKYKVLLVIAVFIIVAASAFFIWLLNPYQASEEAQNFMEADNLKITESDWLVFEADKPESKKGLIFYPGARVEAKAYAPLAAKLAEAGHQVVITPMPLNLAAFGINKAEKVMAEYQNIESWYLAGHSLGGSMAVNYAANNLDQLAGLILLAAFPAESDDLSNTNFDVLSIYADNDNFATLEDIEKSKELLPQNTVWHQIKGGNHSQFAYYGFQRGDNEAEISRAEQQKQILSSILTFMN